MEILLIYVATFAYQIQKICEMVLKLKFDIIAFMHHCVH